MNYYCKLGPTIDIVKVRFPMMKQSSLLKVL